MRCVRGLVVAFGLSAFGLAQSLPRFHAFTVEDTGVDWTTTQAHGMNRLGSATFTRNPSAGGGSFVRYSDGVVRWLTPHDLGSTGDADGPQIDDTDRVLVVRTVLNSANRPIGVSALLYRNGNIADVPPYSQSLWLDIATNYRAVLGRGGHVRSGQAWHFDVLGNLVWLPPLHGYFCGLGGGTSLHAFQGFPSGGQIAVASTRANVHGEWGVVVLDPVGTGFVERLYRMSGTGVFTPMITLQGGELSGTNIWQFNDRREFVAAKFDVGVGRWGAAVLRPDGRFEFLNSRANGSPFVNLDGSGANTTPSPIVLGYRQTLSLRTQAYAMLNGLLVDTTGYRLTDPNGGGAWINDPGQVLAMGYTPAGLPRWLLLHPQPAPVLAIDVPRSRRNAAARQELLPDGGARRLDVRIVGGEPGQPTALFVRLGGQAAYLDGTLGVFDAEQTHACQLTLPSFLIGLDFELVAGALDSQSGILQSLDLRVTVAQ